MTFTYYFREIYILYQIIIPIWMDKCEKAINEHKYQLLQKSGHFFGQLGLWQDCVESPNQHSYYMANFINNRTKANASLFVGMCLPSMCSKESILQLLNLEMHELQPMIVGILGVPLAVGSIDVNPQTYTYDYQPWFFVIMIALGLILGLSIYATLLKIITKRQNPHEKHQKHETQLSKAIQSFNIIENMKIFTYKQNYLNIFNGIKVLCMMWVIWGHLFSVRLKYNVNIAGIPSKVEDFFFLFVTAAFLAVDVFFFIGGFLVAYSFMRQKSKSILKYPMAILHRVLRFWPSYVTVILIYYSVYIHSNNGPLWKQNNTLGQVPFCSTAWQTLLFIDNLVDNGQHMCMGWGWYLQNDMQIFVVSMLFIFLYTKNRMVGYISLICMIILGVSLNIYEVVNREIKQVTHLPDFIKWGEYFVNIYIKPWIRCPPYIFGLICGLLHMEYLELKRKDKEEENHFYRNNFFYKLKELFIQRRWVLWVFQLVGVILMIGTILLPYDLQSGNTWPYYGHGLYLSFQKLSFTLGIYLLILPTLLQVSNVSFFLLDTKFFNFIAKISFWIYLFHFMVVEYVCYSEKVDFYYTPETVIPLYVSVATISCFFGFLGTMFIQVPFAKLEKMLFAVLMKKRPTDGKSHKNDSMLANKQSVNSHAKLQSSNLKESLMSKDGINQSIAQ